MSFYLCAPRPWSDVDCSVTAYFLNFQLKISLSVANLLTAEEPDVDFLQWLSSTVTQAARSAEEHEVLCAASHALTASIENQFKLSHVLVSCSITSPASRSSASNSKVTLHHCAALSVGHPKRRHAFVTHDLFLLGHGFCI